MTEAELGRLVRRLTAMPAECEWVEFKRNNADPQTLGANLSAVSNGAALHRQTSLAKPAGKGEIRRIS